MSSTQEPAIGAPFNPWRGACGFYPPDVVGRDRSLGLTDGQKRLYERLVRYAGRDGRCWPSQTTLAAELGKVERQVRYDLGKLRAVGLIEWHSRKAENGRGSVYQFRGHPIFERQPIAGQAETSDDSNGKLLPVTTGNVLPVDAEVSRSRAATVPLSNGKPLPENSVQEIYTSERAREEYSGSEQERPPAAVRSSKSERTPEEEKVAATLERGGVSFRPGDPGDLLRAGQELGSDPDQVIRFIQDTVDEMRYKHDPVRTAAFLLKILADRLPAWMVRNAPKPKWEPCGKCESGFVRTEQNGYSGLTPCQCRIAVFPLS